MKHSFQDTALIVRVRLVHCSIAWRYLGAAAFGYALLHTLYYLVDIGSLSAVAAEFTTLGIWTGWLAFVVFVPLAVTSNDASVRRLGRRWKALQRFVYLAAVATRAHWLFVSQGVGPALVHVARGQLPHAKACKH